MGQWLKDKDIQCQFFESELVLLVFLIVIFLKYDGIVVWQNCCEFEVVIIDNIEVNGSYCGLGVNGVVLYVVVDWLVQVDGVWKLFECKGLKVLLYLLLGYQVY